MVNLSSSRNPGLLGHISLYELDSGNYYYSYFAGSKFYSAREVDAKTGKTLLEDSSENDYHYSIDIFFNDKSRHLGWSKVFGDDFMGKGYTEVLSA